MNKKSRVVAALFGAALFAASAAAVAAKGADNVIWPADAIKWEDGPVKGTHVAKLWGDYSKGGPYGMLIKFDAGLMHPIHHHTQTMKTVIISGTFVFKPENGTEARLGAGSYLKQQGGKKHISGCSSDADCVFFVTASDKFDYLDDSGGDKKEAAKSDKK
jgi:quercetin dioxygenase-like cupin family protein